MKIEKITTATNLRVTRIQGTVTVYVLVLFLTSVAFAQWPAELRNRDEHPTLAPLLERVTGAVVNISATNESRPQAWFLRNPRGRTIPNDRIGSGVIIDARKGYVVTNHHVIANTAQITVKLLDQREFPAKLLGSDAGTDVALLRIDAKNLDALELSDSDKLRVGDFVIAIGNPFTLGHTVTYGIVSALGRSGLDIEEYEDFIQTDASINPGNSGGALVDLNGRLVGINTAIASPGRYSAQDYGSVGIGFAIPANVVNTVVKILAEHGKVERGLLGISFGIVTDELQKEYELASKKGAFVFEVLEDSAAHKAGIQVEDVIIEINGKDIENDNDVYTTIGLMRRGEKVDIVVIRDNREVEIEATLGDRTWVKFANDSHTPQLAGTAFADIPSDHPYFGKHEGVLVTAVHPQSRAARSGLRPGDIVIEVNREPVSSVTAMVDAIDRVESTLKLRVIRGTGSGIIFIE